MPKERKHSNIKKWLTWPAARRESKALLTFAHVHNVEQSRATVKIEKTRGDTQPYFFFFSLLGIAKTTPAIAGCFGSFFFKTSFTDRKGGKMTLMTLPGQ